MRSSYGILLVSSALLAVVSAKPSVPYGASDSVWKQQHDEAIPHHGGSVVDSAASLLQLNKRQAVSDQSVVLGQASSQWFDDEHYRQAQRSRHAKHHRGFTGSSSAGTPPVGAFTHQNDRGKLVYTALTGAEVERLWDQCDAFLQSNIPQTTESQTPDNAALEQCHEVVISSIHRVQMSLASSGSAQVHQTTKAEQQMAARVVDSWVRHRQERQIAVPQLPAGSAPIHQHVFST